MPKFLGNALDIPAALTTVQAVRKGYVDSADSAIAARVAVLEAGGGGGGQPTGGQTLSTRTVTGNTTAVAGDFVLVDATGGAVLITLPAAPPANTAVAVKKTDTGGNLVTVKGTSPALIDGDADLTLLQPQSGAVLVFDGTNWRVEATVIFDPGASNLTPRGTWATGVDFGINDVVLYQGSSYVAMLASNSVTPNAAGPEWALLAAKGDTGTAGGTGLKGDQGDPGPTGADGADGLAATIAVGTVTEGLPGEAPTVTAGGTSSAVVLDFTLPSGMVVNLLRGQWQAADNYFRGDIVLYDGSTYVAVTDNDHEAPDPDATDPWQLLALRGADGADGVDGQGFRWLGEYDGGTAYEAGDVVLWLGSTFVATQHMQGSAPEASVGWESFVRQSAAGPTGPTGATGPTGPAGPTGATGPAANGSYRHDQVTPGSVWQITHALGYDPGGLTVISAAGDTIDDAVVQYLIPGQSLRLAFDISFAGSAYLS